MGILKIKLEQFFLLFTDRQPYWFSLKIFCQILEEQFVAGECRMVNLSRKRLSGSVKQGRQRNAP